MTLSAVLTPEPEGGYVALNPETGTTTQGESAPAALANLKEATELYLEEFGIQPGARPLLTTFEVSIARAHQPDRANRRQPLGFRERVGSHAHYPGAVTVSGGAGDDAKHYQERQVRRALERLKQ